jgi:glycine hydroxymethyltransferase
MVVDTVRSFDMDGAMAEELLDDAGITVNKQLTPDDPPQLFPAASGWARPPAQLAG